MEIFYQSNNITVTGTTSGSSRRKPLHPHALKGRRLYGLSVKLQPITQAILVRAAQLCATTTKLKTPDAIHVATALEMGCALFMTNDSDLRYIPGLPVKLITELGNITP